MDTYLISVHQLEGMTTTHSAAGASEDLLHSENMFIEGDLLDYQTSTPWPVNPGAPIIGSSSNPFVLSPFDPSPSIPSYHNEADDNETEPSLSAGTSANSSIIIPTPCHLVSDRAFLRLMYAALTPPRSRLSLHASSAVGSAIGLGLLGIFKQDGTPLEGVGTITREANEELTSFLDDFYTDDSPFLFDDHDEDKLSASLIHCPPSPRLLDDVFSSLALAKASVSSMPRSRECSSNGSGKQSGPEEPEYDDVFIERGRITRNAVPATVAQKDD